MPQPEHPEIADTSGQPAKGSTEAAGVIAGQPGQKRLRHWSLAIVGFIGAMAVITLVIVYLGVSRGRHTPDAPLSAEPEQESSAFQVPPELLSLEPAADAAQGFIRDINVSLAELCLSTYRAVGGDVFQMNEAANQATCSWTAPLDAAKGAAAHRSNTFAFACDVSGAQGVADANALPDESDSAASDAPEQLPEEDVPEASGSESTECTDTSGASIFFNAKSTGGVVQMFRYKLNTNPDEAVMDLALIARRYDATLGYLGWDVDPVLLGKIADGIEFSREANGVRYRLLREQSSWRFNLITELIDSSSRSLQPYELNGRP